MAFRLPPVAPPPLGPRPFTPEHFPQAFIKTPVEQVAADDSLEMDYEQIQPNHWYLIMKNNLLYMGYVYSRTEDNMSVAFSWVRDNRLGWIEIVEYKKMSIGYIARNNIRFYDLETGKVVGPVHQNLILPPEIRSGGGRKIRRARKTRRKSRRMRRSSRRA